MASAAAHRFVVRPLAQEQPACGLPSDLKATPLASAQGGWRVETTAAGSVRAAWRVLQQRLGPTWCVIPVVDADDGAERYPTARISIRFSGAVSDAALHAVLKACSLQLLHRTKFSDRQALAAASDPGAYLPDLVAAAARQPGVEAAWLDAEAAYRRTP
jgi:hypothetical protein